MNWSKAKTILIIFFLLINISLVCDIVYTANKSSVITPEIISSTVEVLAKNDIHISSDIIPTRNIQMPYAYVNNIIESTDLFAQKLLGSDCTQISDTEYSFQDKRISFDGDRFSFVSYTPIAFDGISELSEKNAEKLAKSILSDYGISLGKYSCDISDNGDRICVNFSQKIYSYTLFGANIAVTMSKEGLLSIEGVWFEPVSASAPIKNKSQLNSVTGTLIEFILNPSRPQGEINISRLQLGYYLGNDTIYHKSILLIPAWEITLDDASSYYMDARENK